MRAAEPENEIARLRTLRALGVLDTEPEDCFDVFAYAAQCAADSDFALISLVDEDRQWFKASVGLNVRQTPRDQAFCAHAILGEDTFCIEDARLDARFRDNPLVTGAPHIRAYAGAPIQVGGHAIGTVCAISTRPRPFSDHTRRTLARIASAASERLQLSRQLRVQSRLLQNTSDAVVLADSDGRITYWNCAAEAMFGYPAEEAQTLSVSDLAPSRLGAQYLADFARARAGAGSELKGKAVALQGLHRDGSEIPVELTLSLWREGESSGFGAIIRDCRERLALEEARAFSAASDRLLANMSHEIRTPLNGLLGMAQVLAQTSLDPKQSEMVRIMRHSGDVLQRVLSDVLDFTRLQSGQVRIQHEPFDLTAVLADVIAVYRPNAEQKGLGYHASLPEPECWIRSDATRISQIVGNLIGNAVKFTKSGSVEMRVEGPQGGCWSFEVSDTGIGFSKDAASKIFERFHQEDGSITRRFGGSGLGLSICRELARALGGDVVARNLDTGGARFTLTLPYEACSREPARPPPAQPSPAGSPTRLRVLLAEDHPVNRKIVELLLAPVGVDLTMVENGALAVEAFARQRFDVVLMDMQMPVLDGLSAIQAIRRLETERRTPPARVITLTANAFEEHGRAARMAGADDHLTKPIDAQALLDALAPAADLTDAAPPRSVQNASSGCAAPA